MSVYDFFNQNVSVTRTITGNTIQDQRNNVLTRYAMLTFTYNLRQFGAKQQRKSNPFKGMMGGQKMGGGQRGGFGGGGIRKN